MVTNPRTIGRDALAVDKWKNMGDLSAEALMEQRRIAYVAAETWLSDITIGVTASDNRVGVAVVSKNIFDIASRITLIIEGALKNGKGIGAFSEIQDGINAAMKTRFGNGAEDMLFRELVWTQVATEVYRDSMNGWPKLRFGDSGLRTKKERLNLDPVPFFKALEFEYRDWDGARQLFGLFAYHVENVQHNHHVENWEIRVGEKEHQSRFGVELADLPALRMEKASEQA